MLQGEELAAPLKSSLKYQNRSCSLNNGLLSDRKIASIGVWVGLSKKVAKKVPPGRITFATRNRHRRIWFSVTCEKTDWAMAKSNFTPKSPSKRSLALR